MTHDTSLDFTFDLPADAPAPNAAPLADLDGEGPGGVLADGEFGLPNPAAMPSLAYVEVDDRPAAERIDALLGQMAPHRAVLMAVLGRCRTPQPTDDLYAAITALQENHRSIYRPENLCVLLERAGALTLVDAEGRPCADDPAEPQVVVVDGMEYLEAPEPEPAFWLTTPEGAAVVDANDPVARLRDLLSQDERYLPVYHLILALCAREGGIGARDAGHAVDGHPLLQEPRFYATRFMDHLERAEAIAWEGTWQATDTGRACLAELTEAHGDPLA